MNNLNKASLLAFSLLTTSFLINAAFHASPLLAAPEQNAAAATAQAPGAETAPSGLNTVQVGPLEISPSKVNLVLGKQHSNTFFNPTIRFKIKNTSSADVKIILFKNSIEATDELGHAWFNNHQIKSGGISLSDQNETNFNKAFLDEKGKFVTLSPKQIFEAQILPLNMISYPDKDDELIKTHRPKSVTFSANIGIINLDNSTDMRAFSFSDLPVQVSAR